LINLDSELPEQHKPTPDQFYFSPPSDFLSTPFSDPAFLANNPANDPTFLANKPVNNPALLADKPVDSPALLTNIPVNDPTNFVDSSRGLENQRVTRSRESSVDSKNSEASTVCILTNRPKVNSRALDLFSGKGSVTDALQKKWF
jgi:hypothetical protein